MSHRRCRRRSRSKSKGRGKRAGTTSGLADSPTEKPLPITWRHVRLTLADLLAIGLDYWSTIFPRARREIIQWNRRAVSIPDPVLRSHAVLKLTDERLNPEAAAIFSCLAARRRRRALIALIVSYQAVYDYLDAVNEHPGSTALVNGLMLHQALVDAVGPPAPLRDYYAHNPQTDDGGYATSHAAACAQVVGSLPAAALVRSAIQHSAKRCGEAQAHNHAPGRAGQEALRAWCADQQRTEGYLWWEIAAAGISCLGIHGLLALSADPRCELRIAREADSAYFPGLCAASALLDSLADHDSDKGSTNHSFVSHYASGDEAIARLTAIVHETTQHLARLPRRRRQTFILVGVVAYYVSARTLGPGSSLPIADGLTSGLGAAARVMRGAMRLRRLYSNA